MNNEILKRFKNNLQATVDTVKHARLEDDRRRLMSTVGQDIAKMMSPFLQEIAQSAKANKENIKEAVQEIMAEVNARELNIDTTPITDAIERAMGNFYIPEPKVHYTAPPVVVPDIKMPDEMNITGWVSLMNNGKGVGYDNPLPVQLRDHQGNPINLFENLTQVVSGGGSGGSKIVKVSGIDNSAYALLMNADGRIRVSTEAGSGGLTDTELRASSVPVEQVSGSVWSTNVAQYGGAAVATGTEVNASFLRVVHATDVGLSANVTNTVTVSATDLDIRDLANASDSVSVYQVSGASWSVNTGTVTVTATDLDTRDLTNASDSISAYQVSGANWSVNVTNADLDIRDLVNATDSISAYQVSGHRWSTEATQSGTWTVALSGSLTSTVATGPTAVDANDDGSAPVQVGGIARTANPTAVAGGDVVKATHDDLGRMVTRPVQVRDLIQTAYVSVTTGTETTLLASGAGVFSDLIHVIATNNSDAAVTVDLRSATGGGIVTAIRVPANGTAGVACPVPIPQDIAATTWTVDLPDITGTTVTVSALFSTEV